MRIPSRPRRDSGRLGARRRQPPAPRSAGAAVPPPKAQQRAGPKVDALSPSSWSACFSVARCARTAPATGPTVFAGPLYKRTGG